MKRNVAGAGSMRSTDAPRIVDIINLSSSADTLLRERVLAMRARGIDNHIVCMPGPYTVLRPRLPNVKAAGVEKAAGLNHCKVV